MNSSSLIPGSGRVCFENLPYDMIKTLYEAYIALKDISDEKELQQKYIELRENFDYWYGSYAIEAFSNDICDYIDDLAISDELKEELEKLSEQIY